MPQCIYCQQDRTPKHFTKAEHVLPQSFGKFKANLTLIDIVCDECNQYFGDKLETYLARDTLEGQMRFTHGLKVPEDFKTVGRETRMVLKRAEGSYTGCHVKRKYSKEKAEVVVNPLPQIGFMTGSKGESNISYWMTFQRELSSKPEALMEIVHAPSSGY